MEEIKSLHNEKPNIAGLPEEYLRPHPFDQSVGGEGWVDRGGYNVPAHLVGLVDIYGLHPDQASAISDLFESTKDFEQAVGDPNHLGQLQTQGNDRERFEAVVDRWAQLEYDRQAREETGFARS